jgi:hypothetical protein
LDWDVDQVIQIQTEQSDPIDSNAWREHEAGATQWWGGRGSDTTRLSLLHRTYSFLRLGVAELIVKPEIHQSGLTASARSRE